jgi:hypothetical protein
LPASPGSLWLLFFDTPVFKLFTRDAFILKVMFVFRSTLWQ